MILSADVRRRKLVEHIEKTKPVSHQKLYYKNETIPFPVYRIDLDWLIYNRHNGRIEAEMLTWEQENHEAPEEYNLDLHELIDDLLWKSNVSRNKTTLENLREYTQQRPGIISLDGVVIDGNRRSMLLRRLEDSSKVKQYFDAIVLPDAYADNEKEIVRLETQYQLGEDAKVEYGAIQKYLHARRLHHDLGFTEAEIDKLMGENPGNAKKLLGIMNLMDEYLDHIDCPKLYTMLKDSDGTKEGTFVNIYNDLKRLSGGKAKIPWAYDPDFDVLQLKLIHFDYARYGDFANANKDYRQISSYSKGKNFFASKDIWNKFASNHSEKIDPITTDMGSLADFIASQSDDFSSIVDAAKLRDKVWKDKVDSSIKETFNRASHELKLLTERHAPSEYLRRAKDFMEKIDLESPALLSDDDNKNLAMTINKISFEIKKRFEKK